MIVRVNVVLNRTVVVDSDCQQQQSYPGLRSPGRSYSTYLQLSNLIFLQKTVGQDFKTARFGLNNINCRC